MRNALRAGLTSCLAQCRMRVTDGTGVAAQVGQAGQEMRVRTAREQCREQRIFLRTSAIDLINAASGQSLILHCFWSDRKRHFNSVEQDASTRQRTAMTPALLRRTRCRHELTFSAGL